mgnify:CR=1 FL=1
MSTFQTLFTKMEDHTLIITINRPDKLNALNKQLCKFPYTNDYPDYKPHITIAYVKKGLGKKYLDIFNNKSL